MISDSVNNATRLEVRRTFKAPRDIVFQMWTVPDHIKKWHCPGPGYTTPVAEVDLRVGGAYKICMQDAEGRYCVGGKFTEVSAPSRLVYTWEWENDVRLAGNTLVSVDFIDKDGSTEVVILHERFGNEESKSMHEHGWTGCLDYLDQYLATL